MIRTGRSISSSSMARIRRAALHHRGDLPELLDVGADAVTLGNHAWNQRRRWSSSSARRARSGPPTCRRGHNPGRGSALVDTRNGKRALVINAMGRVFMEHVRRSLCGSGWRAGGLPLREAADAIVVDFIARRRARSGHGLLIATAAPASSSARTPMCRPPTTRSFPAAPPI